MGSGVAGASAAKRIEDYAMIGDLQTAAMVATDGSIDWLCLPRFDSPSCFVAMLGEPGDGRWRLAPEGAGRATSRRYVGDTLVLETTWDQDDGSVRVLDLMPVRGHNADVVRIVEGVRGAVRMRSELRAKYGYGQQSPWIRTEGPDAHIVAGPHALWLRADPPVEHADGVLTSEFTVREGERARFVLTYAPSHLPRPQPVDADRALEETTRFWEQWIDGCSYDGRWAEPVRRALLTIKALTYAPTGGIVAAATTSLPEQIGGVRNWDYRYCWLRDATFALQALLGTGYVDEARAWREWLVRAVAGHPADLQIMYTVDSDRYLPELTLDHLSGFAGSRPVRIGNDAAGQRQLDVWGEVLAGLHLAREAGLGPEDSAWELQRGLLDWLEGHWQEPDNGLWEMRGEPRQFVHSKVMAWAGVDRAVRAVEASGFDGEPDRWRGVAREIHDEVCREGYDDDRGTFTQFYGSRGVDAALLLLPRVGFLPWEDPRVRGTITAVERELGRGELLLRYDVDADSGVDPMPHGEGAFLACSFWHADAMLATGRAKEAEALYERLLGLRNDVGLLSEEYDVEHDRQLGNTPQAFSMVGIVNTARHLGGEEMRTDTRNGGPGRHRRTRGSPGRP
jgi:GH15 family glucan-1,4-alpha-glucosidase